MSHSDKGGASASAARGATHNANEPSVEGGESELVANLVELFREVDVNGDGVMEWEEFTRFIVEKAALFKEQNSLDRIPEQDKGQTSRWKNSTKPYYLGKKAKPRDLTAS